MGMLQTDPARASPEFRCRFDPNPPTGKWRRLPLRTVPFTL